MATKRLKHRYTEALGILIVLLALGRCAYEADWRLGRQTTERTEVEFHDDSVAVELHAVNTRYVADGGPYHPILSVRSFRECFPDSNNVQLGAAQRWGVKPVRDRADAELRKDELVYMAASPYYAVAPLTQSIPYLVPRAALLLHDIGQAFFDSLQVKGLPLHHFVVSSVLRSEADVQQLRRFNKNATEQSCHLYGTTFDINYNRYQSVGDPNKELVGGDRLKWVLSEVLADMRTQGRCYVKYEVKQPCFHITVR